MWEGAVMTELVAFFYGNLVRMLPKPCLSDLRSRDIGMKGLVSRRFGSEGLLTVLDRWPLRFYIE